MSLSFALTICDFVSPNILQGHESLSIYPDFHFSFYSFSPTNRWGNTGYSHRRRHSNLSSQNCSLILFARTASEMSTGELLEIEPQELQFPFELRKQISCSMQLINRSDNYVAFKVKTTNPKKYCVRPNTGVVLPRSTADVIVTMQAQKEAPPDMQCKDKFLVQCVVANEGTSVKDIPPNLFNKEEGNNVEESKLRVAYVAPPQPPSPVREGSEEGSSPRASVSDNGTVNPSEYTTVAKSLEPQALRSQPETHNMRPSFDRQESSTEAKRLVSNLTEERNYAIQQRNKVQQELDMLRRRSNVNRGGIPLLYVIIVGVVGILLGYLLKRT